MGKGKWNKLNRLQDAFKTAVKAGKEIKND
jgi:hypothetical protein